MSSEHKTTEGFKGQVDESSVIKMDGKRIVGVNGPTFQNKFLGPVVVQRREIATMIAAQLADKLMSGEVSVEDIWLKADEFVLHESPSLEGAIPAYFKSYMETNRSIEEVLLEANTDFSL